MNRLSLLLTPVILLGGFAPLAFAANEPRDGPPPAREGGDNDRPPRDGDRPPGPRDGDRPGGQRDGDRPRPPGPRGDLDMMRQYLELVDRFSRLAQDPNASGVAAVIAANDLLKAKGPEAAIDYFTKLLPEVKNEAVQRAIRIQLVEHYKAAKQEDKALEQLRTLMTAAPAWQTMPPAMPPGMMPRMPHGDTTPDNPPPPAGR